MEKAPINQTFTKMNHKENFKLSHKAQMTSFPEGNPKTKKKEKRKKQK